MNQIIEKDFWGSLGKSGDFHIKLFLLILYFTLFILVFKYINSLFITSPPPKYYHPFDQWWRRKETNISPWYQDHFFDSKRRDNLFPTYQNI